MTNFVTPEMPKDFTPYDPSATITYGTPPTIKYAGETVGGIIKASQTATSGGRKFDGNKIQYGLLPPLALKATAEILTFGAEKYEPDNWKYVPDSKRRYFDAMQRHLWAWKDGEQNDLETGKNHLAHAMCCLMFLYEHDVKYSKDSDVQQTKDMV